MGVRRRGQGQTGKVDKRGVVPNEVREDVGVVDSQSAEGLAVVLGQAFEVLPLHREADGEDGGEGGDVGLLVVELRKPLLDPVLGPLGHAGSPLRGWGDGAEGKVG